MELQEFIRKKANLETYLATTIGGIVQKFREETGLSPNSINVSMVAITEVGIIRTQYLVNCVTVDIEI